MTRTGRRRHKTSAEGFRAPMSVTEVHQFRNGDTYPVCPQCHITVAREYQAYCDRCGQCLSWNAFPQAVIVMKN